MDPKRKDVEKQLLEKFVSRAKQRGCSKIYWGLGKENRVGVTDWNLTQLQKFQFGDLRVETRSATIVIEVESAGGVTNLVKYWAILERNTDAKPLRLIHIFKISTPDDYIAHRKLWQFLEDKMCSSLSSISRSWRAYLFTDKEEQAALSQFDRLISNG